MDETSKPEVIKDEVIMPENEAQPSISNAQPVQTSAPTYSYTKRNEQEEIEP